MSKVEIYSGTENDKTGIGIRIIDKKASVADLLDGWQPLCDDDRLFKPYGNSNYSTCKGCIRNCCKTAYVIPDLIAFKKIAGYLGCNYQEFLNMYFDVEKTRLGLLRIRPNPCIFLENNICTIYPIRALICRFYLCSHLLGETEQLIYSITFAGIAATQRFAEKNKLVNTNITNGLSSFDMLFTNLINEYHNSSKVDLFMQADDYNDIPLYPFL
jgi:Fe-S-cluster containining protein